MAIAAIVLAAGLSRRMGTPKMILPWGKTTVIGQVVSVLDEAGLDQILVVTGGAHAEVERALEGKPVCLVFNPRFEQSEMVESLQIGLKQVSDSAEAALITLGDQPQIQVGVTKRVLKTYQESDASIVIPSYQMKRGHPWLVKRIFWDEILAIRSPGMLRDFLEFHRDDIQYIPVDTDSILRDLDTPADYSREQPSA
jgi:molybdenum cofactor cytidylyltransferase